MTLYVKLKEKIKTYKFLPSSFFFFIATAVLSLNFIRPFGLAISDWLYFLSLASAILETLLIKPRDYKHWIRNRFIWFAILVFLGSGISLFRSRFLNIAIFEIVQQIYVMTLFVSLTYLMVRRGQMEIVIGAFIFSGALTASVAIWDYCTGSRIGPLLSGTPDIQLWYRFAGTLGHPNKFGYFLVLTGLLTLGKWVKQQAGLWQHIMLGLLLIAQGFGIFLSGSVTAFLGFLLGGTVIILFSYTKKKMLLGVSLMILFPLILTVISSRIPTTNVPTTTAPSQNVPTIIVPTAMAPTQSALTAITPTISIPAIITNSDIINESLNRVQTSTIPGRLEIYKEAFYDILRSPIVGVGSDQVSTSGISSSDRLLEDAVHNVLLQIWYTAGLFAFIGWAGIYVYLGLNSLTMLWHGYKEKLSPIIIALAASVLAVLLMDQGQDAIYQREKWLVFGLFAGIIWLKKENINTSGYLGTRS
jgi:hypothetical protein